MWKLKLDEKGQPVVQDGKYVYINDQGQELALDVGELYKSTARLNGEAREHRVAKEAAEAKLAAFADLDPVAAKDALSKMAAIKDKKMFESGEVDALKESINKVWEAKLAEANKRGDDATAALVAEKIGGAFARSPYIVGEKRKVIAPPDMMQAMFGNRFKLEEGKVVAYTADGNRLTSVANPGELAGFDEALEIIVGSYPNKDSILAATNKSGTGSRPGEGGGGGNGKEVTRAQFEKMTPVEKSDFSRNQGRIV